MTYIRHRISYTAFAATIFLSSFLLFQVQPLIGKYILPWFGGGPGVWSTCMVFFQVALFAGYAYAHFLIKCVSPRWQSWIHLAAIITAIFLLPIAPAAAWKPSGADEPIGRILGLLATTIGLPYFLLAANGPLLQAWFSRSNPEYSPYGLYSLSNVGSLLGLVSYPFLVEPRMTVVGQSYLWSWGFVIFAAFCLACIWLAALRSAQQLEQRAREASTFQKSSAKTYLLWFTLPACSSIMLLAITNQVCLDVAAIPFLWVGPLMLYLLTFILSFGHPIWYPRRAYRIAFPIAIVSLCCLLYAGPKAALGMQVSVYFTALFICCMVCHGEMVLLKPLPSRLTTFYLFISAGGAAGGLVVGLLAPLMFHKYLELHIGMVACCALVVFASQGPSPRPSPSGGPSPWALVASYLGVLLLAVFLFFQANKNSASEFIAVRNFYGVLRVRKSVQDGRENRVLYHGQILHGSQFTEDSLRRTPTTYYGESTGAGLALRRLQGERHVGIVGLGVGTLAVYGREGDTFRFYDINPDVVRLADEYFSFLKDSAARIEHVPGDARLALERETPQGFDILLIDAFSSDAIPTHLLTEEAFKVYVRHLNEEGLLGIHISNRHFDLTPVVRAAADRLGLWSATVHSRLDESLDQYPTTWILLAKSPEPFGELELMPKQMPQRPGIDTFGEPWTDNFTDLFRTLRDASWFPN